jgi:protein-tyrosine phosphatase
MGKKPSILFVCLGNICRSPLAKGIAENRFKIAGIDIDVDSAGFESFHIGDPADPRALSIAAENEIDLSTHRAKLFKSADFDLYDHIYVMDLHNYRDVMYFARNENDRKKVDYLMNLLHPGKNQTVPDPYYGDYDSFEKVFKLISQAIDVIVRKYS